MASSTIFSVSVCASPFAYQLSPLVSKHPATRGRLQIGCHKSPPLEGNPSRDQDLTTKDQHLFTLIAADLASITAKLALLLHPLNPSGI